MLKRSLVLGLSLGSVLVLNAASAQDRLAQNQSHGGSPQEQRACARDVARYCKSMMNADDLTVLGCLQQNRRKLAPACLNVLTSHGV